MKNMLVKIDWYMNLNNVNKDQHTRHAEPLYHPLALFSLRQCHGQQFGSVLWISFQVQAESVSVLKLKIFSQLKQKPYKSVKII